MKQYLSFLVLCPILLLGLVSCESSPGLVNKSVEMVKAPFKSEPEHHPDYHTNDYAGMTLLKARRLARLRGRQIVQIEEGKGNSLIGAVVGEVVLFHEEGLVTHSTLH